MRAIICTRYGPPEVLELAEVPRPSPRTKEVCVRVMATAVTASDGIVRTLAPTSLTRIMARLALGIRAPRQPILGLVMAGQVESVGREVERFQEGDPVFGFTGAKFGTYAELVCVPEDGFITHKPSNLSYQDAAAIPYGGLLALTFLRKAKVGGGQRVLIYGASGAIGTTAIQLVKHLGSRVTAVCSTANLELVKSLGADMVVDYTREDFTKRGERYDVVFDAVGKRKSARALANARDALTATGVIVSVDDGLAKPLPSDLVVLKTLCESGDLRPVIDRTYPLEEMVEAHRYVDKGHKRGNVIVSVLDRPSA